MSRHAAWLRQELRRWLNEGLIDEPTAAAIAARYPASADRSWGLFILTALGSLIFGLGIVLFFAYNWAAMPKAAKLALIFMGLLLSHGIAWWLNRGSAGHANLVEGFHLLGTMLFGAGIWLIAQIYHMDEHYPTALLVWGLGGLSLAWAMPSVLQGLLATFLITAWGLSETLDFHRIHLISIGIVTFTLLPLAWLQRSRTLLFLTLLSILSLVLFTIGSHWTYSLFFKLFFCTSLMLLAAGHWVTDSSFPDSASVLNSMGAFIYGLCLMYMGFTSEFNDFQLLMLEPPSGSESWYYGVNWGIQILSGIVWVALMITVRRRARNDAASRFFFRQTIVVLLSLMLLMACQLEPGRALLDSLPLLATILLAIHCILLIMRGTDTLAGGQVAVGCVVLGILVMARFNDLFDSLLLRSLAFVLTGALLFFVGHRYSKRKLEGSSHA